MRSMGNHVIRDVTLMELTSRHVTHLSQITGFATAFRFSLGE